jgi:deoxyadenosine/deoxycytidine kinase
VEYVGARYEFASPELPDGLVVIEGTNGSGKTTFADLIYFALGGAVKQFSKKGNEQHKEIRSDTNNSVRVAIEINGERYSVTRRFDAPQDILVASLAADAPPGAVEVLPVTRHEGRRIFSDWLLEKLDISAVTLFAGSYRGRLNFTDLLRLIYHDQDPDPARVFMKLDRDSFVTDSRDFRRAVFEILIGASSERYYETLAKLRAAERMLADRQAALAVYKSAVGRLAEGQKDANEVFLREQIEEKETQLQRLMRARARLRQTAPTAASPEAELTILRRSLAAAEVELSALERTRSDLTGERLRLVALEEQLIDEVVRVQKIIHAHETL